MNRFDLFIGHSQISVIKEDWTKDRQRNPSFQENAGGNVKKVNCWEYMQCGREPNGERAKVLGICPASTCAAIDGANGGMNGGRMCWAIVGTYSFGEVRGLFSEKIVCFDCEFHRKVLSEEGFIKSKHVKPNLK